MRRSPAAPPCRALPEDPAAGAGGLVERRGPLPARPVPHDARPHVPHRGAAELGHAPAGALLLRRRAEIGRASCRERV